MKKAENMPHTPFSTALSGSAKETELRIRSIFQWKKQRPPVWLMALMAAVCLSCGSLVSCQVEEQPAASQQQEGQEVPTAGQQTLSPDQQVLLEALYGAAAGQMSVVNSEGPRPLEEVSCQLLYTQRQEDTVLAAASFQDAARAWLVIGAVDLRSEALSGPTYVLSGEEPAIQTAPYSDFDGNPCLLYTFNIMSQGYRGGTAGAVALEDGRLTWVWPVQGDILEESSDAAREFQDFWTDRMALMAPGGVDVFTGDPEFDALSGTSPQYTYDHSDRFWPAPEQDLPYGVYEQARVWLEEQSMDGVNGWDAKGISAAWQIVSLSPADGVRYPYRLGMETAFGTQDYLLTARSDTEREEYLTARLTFDHDAQRVAAAQWDMGTAQELGLDRQPAAYPLPLADGRTLTLEFDESPIDGTDSLLLVRQVKVWDGNTLLQTITAGCVWEDGKHLYEGLYRVPESDSLPGAPDLRDLNGDGSADLGMLANNGFPHNVSYAHFLWDDQAGQLVYSGLFFAPLELAGPGEVVETEYDSGQPDIRRRYTFAPRGSYAGYGAPLLAGLESRGSLPAEEDALPVPAEGISLSFLSGAGAWSTELTLYPDGTFSGEYHDSDMDTVYVCSFEGAFSLMTPLNSHTWSLTLTDMELTTARPIGEEWQEGGVRYISSQPYGLDGGNEFYLCLPGTPADEIPDQCRTWGARHPLGLLNPGAVLDGYGLCNLRPGYGFF